MIVTTTHALTNHGTITTFHGFDENSNLVVFGVDHRPAQTLVALLEAGEVMCEVEGWQIVSRTLNGRNMK